MLSFCISCQYYMSPVPRGQIISESNYCSPQQGLGSGWDSGGSSISPTTQTHLVVWVIVQSCFSRSRNLSLHHSLLAPFLLGGQKLSVYIQGSPNSTKFKASKTEPNCNCGFQTRPPAKAGPSPLWCLQVSPAPWRSPPVAFPICTLSKLLRLRYQLCTLGQFTYLLVCTQQHPPGLTVPAPERPQDVQAPLASLWPCHLAIALQSFSGSS